MKIEVAIMYVLASVGHGMKTEQIARDIDDDMIKVITALLDQNSRFRHTLFGSNHKFFKILMV